MPAVPTGYRQRHRRACTGARGCGCPWEATVGSGRTGKVRRTFPTLTEARTWRTDALKSLERGELRAVPSQKVREAADALVGGMRAGSVRTRSGETYKPSVIRAYDQALALYVLPYVGAMRLSRLRRRDVQALADRLVGEGKSPSTVRMRSSRCASSIAAQSATATST